MFLSTIVNRFPQQLQVKKKKSFTTRGERNDKHRNLVTKSGHQDLCFSKQPVSRWRPAVIITSDKLTFLSAMASIHYSSTAIFPKFPSNPFSVLMRFLEFWPKTVQLATWCENLSVKLLACACLLVQGVRIWGLCRWGGGDHVSFWRGLPLLLFNQYIDQAED